MIKLLLFANGEIMEAGEGRNFEKPQGSMMHI